MQPSCASPMDRPPATVRGGSRGRADHCRLCGRVSNSRKHLHQHRRNIRHHGSPRGMLPRMSRTSHRRPIGPAPDAADLRDAALAYLSRYAATEVGVRRVLERRIDRWARRAADDDAEGVAARAAAARALVHDVVARLVAAGAVNDATYAESRARSLARAGRSRLAAAAHLAAKGVDSATAQAALPHDDETELAAALVLARKRRIGPFRSGPPPDDVRRRRELGVLARAGFSQALSRQALSMDIGQAEALVNRLRR